MTFLRLFLAPIFEVHEIRQAGPREMVIKWSWTMNFWWLRFTPFKVVWDPRLSFTGVTIMGYSESGGAPSGPATKAKPISFGIWSAVIAPACKGMQKASILSDTHNYSSAQHEVQRGDVKLKPIFESCSGWSLG